MKTLVVFSCYDSSLSHVIFILKSNFGTGTGTETPEKNCGHFRNSPPPDLQQTQGTWSSHGWCRRWGPNLPTDPGRVGFVYRTSVGWFGNPKANHRLDGPKTLEKYMGYLPQNKWDKLTIYQLVSRISEPYNSLSRSFNQGAESKKTLQLLCLGSFCSKTQAPENAMIMLMEEIRLISWYGKYPIIDRISYMSGGAGFLPSTVIPNLWWNCAWIFVQLKRSKDSHQVDAASGTFTQVEPCMSGTCALVRSLRIHRAFT